tara:strand:- start:11 stop:937 length:927 start_codon:yes stop_codon:yes gene_type:complete
MIKNKNIFSLLSDEDKNKISNISEYDVDKLIKEIEDNKNIKQKFFSYDNIVDDFEFNQKGIQILRCVLSDRVFEKRRKDNNLRDEFSYENNGSIIIENFIPQDKFEQIETVFMEVKKQIIFNKSPSHNTGFWLDLQTLNPIFDSIVNYLYGQKNIKYSNVELVALKHKKMDNQRDLHFDKWFPNFKLWFLPEDTDDRMGPLHLVKGSHVLSEQKMKWIYTQSLLQSFNTMDLFGDKEYKNYFSHRFYPGSEYNEYLQKMGFEKETPCAFKKNTLVIFDTRCFHRRGTATENNYRFSFRSVFPRVGVFE